MGERALLLLVFVVCASCDKAESVASDSLGRAATAAASRTRELADDASKATKETLAELGDKAGTYVDERLSQLMSDAKDGTLEARIRAGESSATDILRSAKRLSGAVSNDTTVLPIYRPAGDAAKVDEEIGDMPRTEVIDGVTVGFKRVRKLSMAEKADDDAYLVLWRRDDKIIGFVYQKKSRIDIDVLVEETPKLMKLISG